MEQLIYLSYSIINDVKKCSDFDDDFNYHAAHADTTRGTSPDGAFRWLHAKPLNATTRQMLAPYQLGGRHGHRRGLEKKTQNTSTFS